MSAYEATVLQALTIGIGLAIGYFFSRASLRLWRTIVGFIVGFAISWPTGAIIWVFVVMTSNPYDAMLAAISKSFLFALVGAGMGVYFGRREAKLQEEGNMPNRWNEVSMEEAHRQSSEVRHLPRSKVAESTTIASTKSNSGFQAGSDQKMLSVGTPSEESWATALAEFENDLRRPGLWARVYAEANGNESAAKAAYLSCRATELHEKYLSATSSNVAHCQFETQMRIARQYFDNRNSSDENQKMAAALLQTLSNMGYTEATALLNQLNEEIR